MRLQRDRSERRGVILMVVLAMLTLFAIVGITFVLYASAEATNARIAREAESMIRADMDPEQCLAFFLGQLIYDCNDDTTGIFSALRGHSLARSMYGYNYTVNNGHVIPTGNNVPFNGTGRLHYQDAQASIDAFHRVNYMYFGSFGMTGVTDPERVGTHAAGATGATNPYVGGFNAPYTYPDLNNFYLAAVTANGSVLAPSYHRPWLWGGGLNNPNNANWNSPSCFYMTGRPSPNLNAGFPFPEDATGDVKNLVWAQGGNDSIWLDIGAPIMTAPDGTQFKMLVAPLIMDLDNRINLNTAGNIVGPGQTHVSNMGLGAWEVNPGMVLNANAAELLALFTGNGRTQGKYGPNGQPYAGGSALSLPSGLPSVFSATGLTNASGVYHAYAPVDINAWNQQQSKFSVPPIMPAGATLYPTFTGYSNGGNAELVPGNNQPAHPLLYDAYRSPLNGPTPSNDDRIFHPSAMEALLRPTSTTGNPFQVDTNSLGLQTDLLRLVPSHFGPGAGTLRFRNLVTTLSNDLAAPGVMPWWYSSANGYSWTMAGDPNPPAGVSFPQIPNGSAIPFPTVSPQQANVTNGNGGASEFSANWQALSASFQTSGTLQYPQLPNSAAAGQSWILSALGRRINLNQPLPPYPHMGSGMTPTTITRTPVGNTGYGQQYDLTNAAIANQFIAAQTARQTLAYQIFQQLNQLTGIPQPADPNNTLLRYLAQLAVNIVDYIDEDDISTPFPFFLGNGQDPGTVGPDTTNPSGANPAGWVFGTELPRVVLNEAIAETPNASTNNTNVLNNASVQVWVELFNTMPPNAGTNTQAYDTFRVPFTMAPANNGQAYSPYRISITTSALGTSGLMDTTSQPALPAANSNVLGKPAQAAQGATPAFPIETTDADFTKAATTIAGGNQAQAANGPNISPGVDPGSFLLIGPSNHAGANFVDTFQPQQGGNPPGVPATVPIVWAQAGHMDYTTNFPATPQTTPDERSTGLTIMLRRLANPYLPYNGNPTAGQQYNPFITVDYMTNVPVQSSQGPGATVTTRGKRQPFGALTLPQNANTSSPLLGGSPTADQTAANMTVGQNTLVSTFGLQNLPLPQSGSYSWLTHLDRLPTSPMELLHVSGYQPHQLTQQFVVGDDTTATNRWRHYAPWFNQSTRIYRLLEFLECGNRSNGVGGIDGFIGRLPGKININTIYDPEILRALCDASNGTLGPNLANGVDQIFTNLLQRRSPGMQMNNGLVAGSVSANDSPLLPLSAGVTSNGDTQYPQGLGQNNTILQALAPGNVTQFQPMPAGSTLLFEDPNNTSATHPYIRASVLNKIYNNITTRSNVFAVFLTVGFFQVTNATTSPPTLGAEIGRAEGRHIRHRMFAIVDRTHLAAFSTTCKAITPAADPNNPGQVLPTQLSTVMGATSGTNPNTGVPWQLAAGMQLTVEPGTDNEETVSVTTDANGNLVGTFLRPHPSPNLNNPPQSMLIINRGNPGPWLRYDPRQDPLVVPYISIIQ